MSGSLEEGLAEAEVPFDRREIQQRQKPRLLPLDQVLIAAVMEVAEETVALVVLPADEVYRVDRRRLVGRVAMADPAVVAVDGRLSGCGASSLPGGLLSATFTSS